MNPTPVGQIAINRVAIFLGGQEKDGHPSGRRRWKAKRLIRCPGVQGIMGMFGQPGFFLLIVNQQHRHPAGARIRRPILMVARGGPGNQHTGTGPVSIQLTMQFVEHKRKIGNVRPNGFPLSFDQIIKTNQNFRFAAETNHVLIKHGAAGFKIVLPDTVRKGDEPIFDVLNRRSHGPYFMDLGANFQVLPSPYEGF